MIPGKYDLYVRSGDSVRQVFTVSNPGDNYRTPGSPIDLTGCEAEMSIVPTAGSSYNLKTTTVTTNGGTITLGGTAGTITLYIPPADTLTLREGNYDLRLKYPSGDIDTLLEGTVTISPAVTVWQ